MYDSGSSDTILSGTWTLARCTSLFLCYRCLECGLHLRGIARTTHSLPGLVAIETSRSFSIHLSSRQFYFPLARSDRQLVRQSTLGWNLYSLRWCQIVHSLQDMACSQSEYALLALEECHSRSGSTVAPNVNVGPKKTHQHHSSVGEQLHSRRTHPLSFMHVSVLFLHTDRSTIHSQSRTCARLSLRWFRRELLQYATSER